MIAAVDFVQDGCTGNLLCYAITDKEVVNTPTGVVFTGVKAIAPPAIGAGYIGMPIAERIGKSRVKKFREALAFFIRKSGVFVIATGIFEVNLSVGNIEVSTGNEWFLCRKFCNEISIALIPNQALVKPCKLFF